MMKIDTVNKIIFISSLLVSGSAIAGQVPEIDCLIEPNMMIELSSPVSGVLDTILVDRSDAVQKGQIVATLKSDVEQVKLKASQESLDASLVEQQRASKLYRDRVITLSEKEQADHELALNKFEVEHALANLELHNIRSPIDGVVADRFLMPGEFIEENPILKLAQLDPLRVEVVAPVTYFGRIRKGMHAQVKTDYGSFDNLVGEVVVVDKVIDAASGTFGIRLELQNRDNQVPGGLKCSVRFFDEQEEADYAMTQSTLKSDSSVAAPVITDQDMPGEPADSICRRLGPFKQKDKVMALMDAIDADITGYDIHDDVKTTLSYLVTTGTLASGEAAESLTTKMKQNGIRDVAITNHPDGASVALGVYSNKQSAYKRLAKIKKLGFDCKVVTQEFNKATYWVEITTHTSEDGLSELVTATGMVDNSQLIYQSCSTEILASGSLFEQ
jgi:RND family efflux transporter MFP subunit